MPDEGGVTKMIKNLLKSFFIFTAFIWATGICSNQAMADEGYCGIVEHRNKYPLTPAVETDTEEVKTKISELQSVENELKSFCQTLSKLNPSQQVTPDDGAFSRENRADYTKRFETILDGNQSMKKKYEELKEKHETASKQLSEARGRAHEAHKEAVKKGEYTPCGTKYPEGCPKGKECFSKRSVQQMDSMTNLGAIERLQYDCLDPEDMNLGWNSAPKGNLEENEGIKTQVGAYSNKIEHDELGNTKISESTNTKVTRGDNSACSIPDMQKMYQSTCYSCKIIMTLITTFMNACAKVYDLTRDAGVKVLVIGSMLWLAAFALKLVSAFTNQEPMSILHTLFVFMFKVSAAYLVITIGIGVIVNLFINPLLMAGADYGLGLLQAANQGIIKIATTTNFPYTGTEIISTSVINKIMALTQGIDKTVSTNLVIGHALTCHSFNAGALTYTGPLSDVMVTIIIPDIWIWLCGAAIWFCGFMLTLGVGYYLLDVCFKIGFCIIALPIVIGLWPFGPTSSKFNSCMSIVFRSAGLFVFLALTVSYALSLISASLGDLTTFYAKIKAGDAEWVSNTFSISGSSFILIMFAYVYGIKMVGATVSDYVGKFFGDSVFGGASPMHMKATQITAMAKSKVTQAASFAGGVVTHQATRAAGAVAGGAVNFVKKQVKRGKSSGGNSGSSNSGGGSGTSGGGNPPSGGSSGSGSNGGSSGNGGSAGAAG